MLNLLLSRPEFDIYLVVLILWLAVVFRSGKKPLTDAVYGPRDHFFPPSWSFRMDEVPARLSGVKPDPGLYSIGTVGAFCTADYALRYGEAIKKIPLGPGTRPSEGHRGIQRGESSNRLPPPPRQMTQAP
jgi:hypothetical protein